MMSGSEPRGLGRRDFVRLSALAGIAVGTTGILSSCGPATSTHSVLRVGSTTDIDSLNPFTAFSTQAVDVLQLVYDKLMDYDDTFAVIPSLASERQMSADGRTFTYTVRDGVNWHDGTPLTADDVVFTFQMVKDNNYGSYGSYLSDLTSAQRLPDGRVQLHYSTPQPLEPGVIMPIVPRHIWSKLSKRQLTSYGNSHPIGSGPFRDVSWKKGEVVSVVRNERWWGPRPAAVKVTWSVYGSDDVVAQALRTGAVDIVPELPPTIYAGLASSREVRRESMESFSFHMIGFNCSTKKGSKGNRLLLDERVRQALSLSVNRRQLVELALSGQGEPGTGLLPPAFGDFHYSPTGDDLLDNDRHRAKALLDTAGYTDRDGDGIREAADGTKLEFRILAIADTTVDVKAAQLFAVAANKVGIRLKLATTDADTMGSTVLNVDTPDWDAMVWGWDSGLYDPSYLLGIPTTAQVGGDNDTFWTNADYDALFAQQSQTLDHATRVALVQEMQRIHYNSCPYIVMWYQKKLTGLRKNTWTGWRPQPGGMVLNFSRTNYLDTRIA